MARATRAAPQERIIRGVDAPDPAAPPPALRTLAHLLLLALGVLAVEGYLPLHLFPPDDLAGPAPVVVGRVQADYFRRGRIERQAVVAPNLIRRVLLPTLGCPARLGAGPAPARRPCQSRGARPRGPRRPRGCTRQGSAESARRPPG